MICISRPGLAKGLAFCMQLLRCMTAQRKPAGRMGASEAQFIKCGQEFGPESLATFHELVSAGRHNRQNLKQETHRPPSLHPPRPLIRNLASGTASWSRMKGSMVGSSKNKTVGIIHLKRKPSEWISVNCPFRLCFKLSVLVVGSVRFNG